MEKRHFNRKRCIATAVAAAALAGFALNADAALTLELTEATGTNTMGSKTINIGSLTAVTLDVWATVTGTDGTSSNDGLQSANMSFVNTGSLGGAYVPAMPNSNFADNGAQPGTANFDGNGGLGSSDPSVATGFWIARSEEVQSGTGAASNGSGSFKLGTLTFNVTSGSGGQTSTLQLIPRASQEAGLWFEDSTITDPGGGAPLKWSNELTGTTGSINVGAGVLLSFTGGVGTPNLWAATGGGSWGTGGNWDDGAVPASGASVTFGASIGNNNALVTLDAPRTVGGILINNTGGAGAYTIDATANALTINAGATLDVTGNHAITGVLSYGGAVTKAGSGNLTVPNVRTSGALAVDAGTLSMAADGGATGVSKVGSLTVNSGAGAQLDLKDNDVIVDYSGASPRAALTTLLASGFAGGTWSGNGIGTSAPLVGGERSIGIAEASFMFGLAGAATASYQGQTVDADSVVIKYTYAGDTNLDGQVNIGDLGVLAGNWQQSGKTWQEGDYTYDGNVNIGDLGLLAGNWQKGVGSPLAPPVGDGVTAVPEPGSLGLLAVAGMALLRRRRK